MYRSRVLAGIVLAVFLAGGLGLVVAQIFPPGTESITSVETSTSIQVSTATSISTATEAQTSTAVSTETVTNTVSATTTATASTTATSLSTSETSQTVSSSSSATTATGTSIESSTSTCELPQYCGEFNARSPALEASNSSSGYSTLTFTLSNAGNLNLTDIKITINNQTAATVLGVAPAQSVTYFILLSPEFIISIGHTYQVEITSITFYGEGPSIEFSVTAAQ